MTQSEAEPAAASKGGAFLAAVRARSAARAAAAEVRVEAAVEPGLPPVASLDVPLDRPSSPAAAGPADPVEIADACDRAGRPELTLRMLQRHASMADVEAELQRATDITEAARRLGVPAMAETAILGGVSVATFREMATVTRAGG